MPQLHLLEPLTQVPVARSMFFVEGTNVNTLKTADIEPHEFYLWTYLCSGKSVQDYADANCINVEIVEQIASDLAAKFDEPDLEPILDRLRTFDFGS